MYCSFTHLFVNSLSKVIQFYLFDLSTRYITNFEIIFYLFLYKFQKPLRKVFITGLKGIV